MLEIGSEGSERAGRAIAGGCRTGTWFGRRTWIVIGVALRGHPYNDPSSIYFARSIYRPSVGSTRIRSPSLTNGGTVIVTPFSSVAGLLTLETVALFNVGSVRVTSNSIEGGRSIPMGAPS